MKTLIKDWIKIDRVIQYEKDNTKTKGMIDTWHMCKKVVNEELKKVYSLRQILEFVEELDIDINVFDEQNKNYVKEGEVDLDTIVRHLALDWELTIFI